MAAEDAIGTLADQSANTKSALLALVPLAILLGGSINGLAARVIDATLTNGLSLPLLGLSPFEVLVVVAAAVLMTETAAAQAFRPGAAEAATLAALLIPSSIAAWIATGCYAAYRSQHSRGSQRAGALLFVGAALAALWTVAFARWLVEPATGFEAWLAAGFLAWLQSGVTHAGNVISAASGHSLVVLAACSAFEGLPRAIVGVCAVALLAGATAPRTLLRAAGLTAVLYFAANVARLMLIASSADGYEIGHSANGSTAYDALQTALVVGIGYGLGRK